MPLIDAALAALDHAPRLYAQCDVVVDGLPGAPPSGSRSKPGKPASRTPAGVDRQVRAAMVEAARAVMDCADAWSAHATPARPILFPGVGTAGWQPVERVRVHHDRRTGQVTPTVVDTVARVWGPDPSDDVLTPPSADRFAARAEMLASFGDLVATLDVDHARDDAARRGCEAALRCRRVLQDVLEGDPVPADRFGGKGEHATHADRCSRWPRCTNLRERDRLECRSCRHRRSRAA